MVPSKFSSLLIEKGDDAQIDRNVLVGESRQVLMRNGLRL